MLYVLYFNTLYIDVPVMNGFKSTCTYLSNGHVNVKVFNLLPHSIALQACSLSVLKIDFFI